MEKIETKEEEIKKESAGEIFPKEVTPEKEKIKRKRIYKKMEKSLESKSKELKNMAKKESNWLKAVIIVLILCFILGISGTAFYFYRQYKKAVAMPSVAPSPEEQATIESQKIKETIGKFMELPTDEEPVLATVKDAEKVSSQKFFAKAQNGDVVLIYTNNKRAILFRPSTEKIIEVSIISGTDDPVPVPDPDSQENSETTQEQPNDSEQSEAPIPSQDEENIFKNARIMVYNGTTTKGLAKSLGERIAMLDGIKSVSTENAAKNYSKNIVIDLTGDYSNLSNSIAESILGEIGELPEGEKKPDADILVIGGKI